MFISYASLIFISSFITAVGIVMKIYPIPILLTENYETDGFSQNDLSLKRMSKRFTYMFSRFCIACGSFSIAACTAAVMFTEALWFFVAIAVFDIALIMTACIFIYKQASKEN